MTGAFFVAAARGTLEAAEIGLRPGASVLPLEFAAFVRGQLAGLELAFNALPKSEFDAAQAEFEAIQRRADALCRAGKGVAS